jgi:hypothetical protein
MVKKNIERMTPYICHATWGINEKGKTSNPEREGRLRPKRKKIINKMDWCAEIRGVLKIVYLFYSIVLKHIK